MAQGVHVEGLSELLAALHGLPPQVMKNIVTKGLRKIAGEFRDRVRQRAPVRTGTLRRNIIRKDGRRGRYFQNQLVTVKPITKKSLAKQKAAGATKRYKGDSFYAHMVHWGTKSHAIPKKGSMFKKIADAIWAKGYAHPVKKVIHPGAKANRFFLRAWQGEKHGLIDKIYFMLLNGLEKELRSFKKGPAR